ncbi:MAG: YraN family protein [Deltaproteobacteria bacterium]|nr:YraN family protein [Deltaproteobacteria bacterium]
MNRRAAGTQAENLAAEYLRKLGYVLLDRNYQIRQGEIDLVAQNGSVLCFVEVRSRSDNEYGLPEESINRTKRRRIARAAEHYLVARGRGDSTCRFDVVTVDGQGKIRLIQDAFRLEDC